ncbi:hypothetical protein SLA2020_444810 [Shorea laevis]
MASSKVAALLFITMIVLLASFEVGEAIRWIMDKNCYKKCSDKCRAAVFYSLCKGLCKLDCTYMENDQVGSRYDIQGSEMEGIIGSNN